MSESKPLGQKAYGHIGHLPGSRMGPADHQLHPGQARIATTKVRDKHDRVYVQEKLDGSCVAVAKVNGELIPLGRAGYRAITSPFEQHHLFHDWALANAGRFDALLGEGERAVGEWLAQAHGTRYDLTGREPFVLFDLMHGTERAPVQELLFRGENFEQPQLLCDRPMDISLAMEALRTFGFYGAQDPVEGCVWRVERNGKVDFLAKYVRPDKVDGSYLPERGNESDGTLTTDGVEVWNWRPETVSLAA